MEKKYLIDTNVIAHLFAEKLPVAGKEFVKKAIDENFVISVVVEIEVLTYNEVPEKMPLIEEFVSLATVLPLDKAVTQKAIELRRSKRKLKLADAIIAATAIIYELTLITNNTRDFLNIAGLHIVDPHNV